MHLQVDFCFNCPCLHFCEPVLIMDKIPVRSNCERYFSQLTGEDSITCNEFWFYKIYTEGNDIVFSMSKEWVEHDLCGLPE